MESFWRKRFFLGTFLLFFLLIFLKPIIIATSTALFLTQVFPLPFKPQGWFTQAPKIEVIEFFSGSQKVIGKIYRPPDNKTHPAVITAMAVRTSEGDKPILTNFAQSLARMGFVVLAADSEDLEKEKIKIQGKEVFISTFEYLSASPHVEKGKISFIGFSVGSSVAIKAAQDPQIAERVQSLIFFGGYFDLVDYLSSLVTKTAVYKDQEFPWQPHEHVLNRFKEIMASFAPSGEQEFLLQVLKEGEEVNPEVKADLSSEGKFILKLFEVKNRQEFTSLWPEAPEKILQEVNNFSPAVDLKNLKTQLFILHDRGDRNVPFVESRKLNEALPQSLKQNYLEVSLFEHVKPQRTINLGALREIFKLFLFLNQFFLFISR